MGGALGSMALIGLTNPETFRQHTSPVMNLYLVLLLSVLSALHWTHGQDPVEEEAIVVQHVQPLGGWSSVSPNQKDVQDAARKGLENFNKKSKAKKYFKMVDVTSAKIQVSNMINYRIKTIIGKTKCLKTENGDLDSCEMLQKRLKCKFDVQFDPRKDQDQYKVNSMSCNK
ncbi:hypothetical protein HF521_002531 [Silurus meridionalis]|uniref:Cystatin domain-containing protein n=1 Tax=Silurus meridionalis TaxID=175797 RepID=A0A8T0B9E6_SILME|nr:hypothetical protein HF521_002531 [Silurus meridionalis]